MIALPILVRPTFLYHPISKSLMRPNYHAAQISSHIYGLQCRLVADPPYRRRCVEQHRYPLVGAALILDRHAEPYVWEVRWLKMRNFLVITIEDIAGSLGLLI